MAQSEQQVLDAGGGEASKVVEKAFEQLASTEVFELPDVGWGRPSASCWALTVILRHAPKDASDRLSHIATHSKRAVLRLYALIGLHVLHPQDKRWNPSEQPKAFLEEKIFLASGDVMSAFTIAEVLDTIRENGGYKSLLLPSPLPRLYQTWHPPHPNRRSSP